MEEQPACIYRISGKFSLGNFLSGLESVYFHGLIFIVCPEHVIIVACCLDVRELIFRFGALHNKKYYLTKISLHVLRL